MTEDREFSEKHDPNDRISMAPTKNPGLVKEERNKVLEEIYRGRGSIVEELAKVQVATVQSRVWSSRSCQTKSCRCGLVIWSGVYRSGCQHVKVSSHYIGMEGQTVQVDGRHAVLDLLGVKQEEWLAKKI